MILVVFALSWSKFPWAENPVIFTGLCTLVRPTVEKLFPYSVVPAVSEYTSVKIKHLHRNGFSAS